MKLPAPGHLGRAGKLSSSGQHLISAELKALLDRCESSRSVLRALAVVEAALSEHGELIFHKMPVEILACACGQLDRLVVDWSPRGLAELRSRLACVVIERGSPEFDERVLPVMSTFHTHSRLGVDDASISIFEEAQREWGKSPPVLGRSAAPHSPPKR